MTEVERPAELFQLDASTCRTLLTTQHVGRLVVGGDDPAIVPVTYRVVGEVIHFRTTPDSRVGGGPAQPALFEVDMIDARTRSGWSVVVHGRLHHGSAADADVDVEPWAPGSRDEVMTVRIETITGRLLRGAVETSMSPGGYL